MAGKGIYLRLTTTTFSLGYMSMASVSSKIPKNVLDALSDESKTSLNNLIQYLSTLAYPDLSIYPQSKQAAVLVLLFEQDRELRVLLTTRSKELRTHAGQTALPGGKRDPTDIDHFMTAFREAHEEVSLPLNCSSIFTLGILEPFISLHRLLVTPVVAFLSDTGVLSMLKAAEGEVANIFNHRLKALLDPILARDGVLVAIGSEDWPYETELYNTSDSVVPMLGNTTYRMHRFRTSGSPIKGLTADILIKTAEIAYGCSATYERYAPEQLRNIKDIIQMLERSGLVPVVQLE